mmetsp:Transcript_12169/g.40030  ORF Transcript_12169/g.40030 Transcript_12169/m.40030 type:complete len:390 (-) Transcript_12169:2050-3219(-)
MLVEEGLGELMVVGGERSGRRVDVLHVVAEPPVFDGLLESAHDFGHDVHELRLIRNHLLALDLEDGLHGARHRLPKGVRRGVLAVGKAGVADVLVRVKLAVRGGPHLAVLQHGRPGDVDAVAVVHLLLDEEREERHLLLFEHVHRRLVLDEEVVLVDRRVPDAVPVLEPFLREHKHDEFGIFEAVDEALLPILALVEAVAVEEDGRVAAVLLGLQRELLREVERELRIGLVPVVDEDVVRVALVAVAHPHAVGDDVLCRQLLRLYLVALLQEPHEVALQNVAHHARLYALLREGGDELAPLELEELRDVGVERHGDVKLGEGHPRRAEVPQLFVREARLEANVRNHLAVLVHLQLHQLGLLEDAVDRLRLARLFGDLAPVAVEAEDKLA